MNRHGVWPERRAPSLRGQQNDRRQGVDHDVLNRDLALQEGLARVGSGCERAEPTVGAGLRQFVFGRRQQSLTPSVAARRSAAGQLTLGVVDGEVALFVREPLSPITTWPVWARRRR